VTLTDHLARMLVHKGTLTHAERGLIFRNAIGFLRATAEPHGREAADILERFWEDGLAERPPAK